MGRKIQIIFSGFALVMLGLTIWRVSAGLWSNLNWAMLAVAAVCCLLVFLRFVYIFTYSYALAAIINGALIWAWLPSPAGALAGGAAVFYGLRLLSFTWSRERSLSYAPRVANVIRADDMMPAPVKISLWLMCTLLLTYHLMAVVFAAGQATLSPGVVAGALLMILGTVIEGVADAQKQRSKEENAERLVTSGLFRRWRHPNYAGEILVQLGLMVIGLASVAGPVQALMVVIAPAYIAVLMMAEASRVDGSQAQKYGDGAEYGDWRKASGSLLPRF